MSYILDALKKSDQERQQNTGPSLQTVHRPHLINKNSNRWGAVIFISVVVVCSTVLGLWYINFASVSTVIESKVVTDSVDLEPVPVPDPSPIESDKPVTKISQSNPSAQTVNDAAIAGPVVEFWELPDPVQTAIPALTFSFHVYSSNPDKRTIIINKHRVREGDSVSHGLILEEITEQGVILQWQQRYRFSINVVESW
ncbi:MAG TPA: hypothetical protein ENI05_07910 [Porticoccus sp.]|nr:hypothetical protein [Porticoccus sp.]